MIGEATRIPLIQDICKKIFDKDTVARTQSSSEVVAKGCSLAAAMILPQFHVTNFVVDDFNGLATDFSWSVEDNQMKTKTLFPVGNNFPSIKSLTFEGRTTPMDVGVSYNSEVDIVEGIPKLLARYNITPPQPKEEKFALKLRVKLDQNQIPALDTVELIEDYMEEKKIPVKIDPPKVPAPKEGEKEGEAAQPAPPAEQTYETKQVQKQRKTPVQFKWEQHGYNADQIKEFNDAEDRFQKFDENLLAAKTAKNDVETYVYDMRANLDTVGNWKPYIEGSLCEQFLETLN